MGCDTASLNIWIPEFQCSTVVSSPKVLITLEDETNIHHLEMSGKKHQ
jgi:hypothetical protein